MKKLLVTGNSHAGVIKEVVSTAGKADNISQFNFEFACFAGRLVSPNYFTNNLFNVRDYKSSKTFVDVSSEQNDCIDLKSYDAVLLCGSRSVLDLHLYIDSLSDLKRPLSRTLVQTIVLERVNQFGRMKSFMSQDCQFLWMGSPPIIPKKLVKQILGNQLECHTSELYDLIFGIVSESNISNALVKIIFPERGVLDNTLFCISESCSVGGLRFDGRSRAKNDPNSSIRNHGNLSYGLSVMQVINSCLC